MEMYGSLASKLDPVRSGPTRAARRYGIWQKAGNAARMSGSQQTGLVASDRRMRRFANPDSALGMLNTPAPRGARREPYR